MKRKNQDMKKNILFSGITPTGTLTIGHYLGVIKEIIKKQKEYQILIMIADLHALTTFKKEKNYKLKSEEIASLLYACGIKKKNCKIFIQSKINGNHSEMTTLLSSFITVEKLKNMAQFREKKKKNSPSLSLLSYPILMASDIFMYKPKLVIVGEDQKQHCELTKFIGNKINNIFEKKVLEIPNFSIPKMGSKIMGLKNPEKKMSKSEEDKISLLEEKNEIIKKIKSAKTDNENKISYDKKNKPGISNLMIIYSLLKKEKISKIEERFKKTGYHEFKSKISNLIIEKIEKIRKKYDKEIKKIKNVLKKNENYVKKIARETIEEFKKEMKIN